VGTLAERYDAFLLDLDGVLYRGDEPVDGAPEAVEELRKLGKRIAFVTNNSSRTPAQVAEKLAGVGVSADPEEVVTSALATAWTLARRGGGSAFVIGEAGIRTALAAHGIEVVDGTPERTDYVIVGWDRNADYARLRTAALLVQRGSSLVATNADPSYPAPKGLWPGAGALLAVVTTTLGRPPDEVIGKPHPTLYQIALERSGGGRPLVVGDRLDTDIAGAAPLGWDSLLVWTGVAGPADLLRTPALPTFVGKDLSVLRSDPPTIRPARAHDSAAIEHLLAATGLTEHGVEERLADTFVADREDRLAGTASLELFGHAAHLRSVAVAEGLRRAHVGTLLVARAVERARERGARELYAVTEDAAGFFERLGLERIGGKGALPDPIASTPMVREHCSTSSEALRLALG
jgi:HAD superfamily hydrolase (TIGR01457 family)